eukprot:1158454-Pelagomonas_calceolata.AAC.4
MSEPVLSHSCPNFSFDSLANCSLVEQDNAHMCPDCKQSLGFGRNGVHVSIQKEEAPVPA